MGNCLKSINDDVSLIGGNFNQESVRETATLSSSQRPPYSRMQPEQPPEIPAGYSSTTGNRLSNQQPDDEQIKMARRIGLISHLPTGKYDGTYKKAKECVICMNEFTFGEQLRYLPCMHIYHKDCIDDWLMRSFTCPSCLEPVDAALLTTYQTG